MRISDWSSDVCSSDLTIAATYPGADAETLERTTTQIIEQQMKGTDNLRYFSASSSSAGNVTITLTFEPATDPNIPQVQSLARALYRDRVCPYVSIVVVYVTIKNKVKQRKTNRS